MAHSDNSDFDPKTGDSILVKRQLVDELIQICVQKLPRQAYGLVGGPDARHPTSVYPCSTNLRDSPEWASLFESFGEFYRDPDRGFVITPDEFLAKRRQMESRGESFVGVFHSHRKHGPEPTKADLALHVDPRVLCYIVSLNEPGRPELKVYRLHGSHFELARHEAVD